ncbi:hypothetical protein OAU50_05770, partial [Planctomycetota bacterium]|nr:hypothetical protein [Planctomycetota bacterium]
LRIFWTVAAILIPLQGLGYFLICRIHSHSSVTLGVIMLALYVGFLLLVPSLSAPAEAVIPSRRVRREMAKLPKAFTGAGGSLFFPGSLRGVIHSGLITIVASVLVIVTAWFAYGQLDARNEDPANLRADYSNIVNQDQDMRMRVLSTLMPTSYAPSEEMLATVEKYTEGEWQGFLLMLAAMVAVVLVCSQFSWRMSLNGLSKNFATVVGALILLLWIVAPFIIQMITDSASNEVGDSISRFSPIQGLGNGIKYGELTGYQPPNKYGAVTALDQADLKFAKWVWFMASAGVLWVGLVAWNLASFKSVKAKIDKLTGEDNSGQALPENAPAPAPVAPAPIPVAPQMPPIPTPQQATPAAPAGTPPAVDALPDASEIEVVSENPPENPAEDES